MKISSAARPLLVAAMALSGAAAWAATPNAVDPDDFLATKTSDMVDLCTARQSEANYVAAIHFCHGFASGAFQYYQAIAATSPANRFVCLPDPAPTRSAAIADFVQWAKTTPGALDARPVDSIMRFLQGRYPCTNRTTSLEPKAKAK